MYEETNFSITNIELNFIQLHNCVARKTASKDTMTVSSSSRMLISIRETTNDHFHFLYSFIELRTCPHFCMTLFEFYSYLSFSRFCSTFFHLSFSHKEYKSSLFLVLEFSNENHIQSSHFFLFTYNFFFHLINISQVI